MKDRFADTENLTQLSYELAIPFLSMYPWTGIQTKNSVQIITVVFF
jgi:hypothetical protein